LLKSTANAFCSLTAFLPTPPKRSATMPTPSNAPMVSHRNSRYRSYLPRVPS
jgi:hypothetical protein